MTNATPRTPERRPILLPAAWVYSLIIGGINRRFDRRKGVVEFDRPVISVGNLSTGGTGKTPMVATIVRWLREAGHDPAIAMRGYAPRGGVGGILSDEARTYAGMFEDLPLVAQPDRIAGLIRMFGTERGERVDSVVLDDGFQHRQIARQLDIALIDATRDPFGDALLPVGSLREPVSSLRRADVVVLTHADAIGEAELSSLERSVRGVAPGAIVCQCVHAWAGLRVAEAAGERDEPVAMLGGMPVVVACAIGNPSAFVAQASRHADVRSTLVLRDHHPFDGATVERVVAMAREHSARAIVVTEKDWAKMSRVPRDRWPCEVVRPVLRLEFLAGGEALLERVLETASMRLDDEEPPQIANE
ncbi:MAG: tetraacyldisaccharide 4'-kinase [Phycisphaerales bacterium]|nr:MAG: tetraacyldisaccharide 4'-kinase [Phycisphaerales bacterium]